MGQLLVGDYIFSSIERFQLDCLQLCEQHYPTVHNRGMRENHLGKALSRRIIATLNDKGIPALFEQCQSDEQLPQPIFRIHNNELTIWIIAQRLLSANLARRKAFVQTIIDTCQKMDAQQPNYLVVVADHWFDRSKASKEILGWWLGCLPDNIEPYNKDGVRLLMPEHGIQQQFEALGYPLNGSYKTYHPLKKDGSRTIHKYILLSAFFEFPQQ